MGKNKQGVMGILATTCITDRVMRKIEADMWIDENIKNKTLNKILKWFA